MQSVGCPSQEGVDLSHNILKGIGIFDSLVTVLFAVWYALRKKW